MNPKETMAKKFDEDICRWIIEFLLRQSIDHYEINKVLNVLPVPNNCPKIKKLVLLRSIQTEISDASVSETILEMLEIIEELDRQEKIRITGSMKAAYCAVAVECTVKYMIVNKDRKGKYLDAVNMIWRGRVASMVESNESELVSDGLLKWREEIEAAIWDVKMSKKLLEKNTRNDALKKVRVYLGEALAISGPPFLKLAMRMMKKVKEKGKDSEPEGSGDATKGNMVQENGKDSVPEGPGDATLSDLVQEKGKDSVPEGPGDATLSDLVLEEPGDATLSDLVQEKEKDSVLEGPGDATMSDLVQEKGKDLVPEGPGDAPMSDLVQEKGKDKEIGNSSVGTKRKHLPVYSRHRCPAKITGPLELEEEDDAACSKYDSLPSPEVSKVQEALKASALELPALVKDPLPDALRMAEAVISHMAENIENLEPLAVNQIENDKGATNLPNLIGTGSVEEPVQAKEGDRLNQSCGHRNNLPKPSIMERNGSARTYEWKDSIDDSPGETSNHPSRKILPSPKRKAVSPPRKDELTKFARRRKRKPWSLEEEDALFKAVEKFGKGNWKLILNSNRHLFVQRSEVDLKDKWRNMTK